MVERNKRNVFVPNGIVTKKNKRTKKFLIIGTIFALNTSAEQEICDYYPFTDILLSKSNYSSRAQKKSETLLFHLL